MNNINRQKAVAARHGVTQDQLSNYGGSRSGTNSPSAGASEGSSYRVGHIFKTGNSAVDASRLYMDVDEASGFLNKKGGADTIDIVLNDVGNTTDVQLELFQRLPDYYYVETWKEKSEKDFECNGTSRQSFVYHSISIDFDFRLKHHFWFGDTRKFQII